MKKLILLSILMLPVFNLMADDHTYTKVVDETVKMVDDVLVRNVSDVQVLLQKDSEHYIEAYQIDDTNLRICWIDHVQYPQGQFAIVMSHSNKVE